jgi:hypothetical protein
MVVFTIIKKDGESAYDDYLKIYTDCDHRRLPNLIQLFQLCST